MNGPKEQALGRIDAAHRDTIAFFRGLSEDQLAHPVFGEGDGWRIRDLIPHIALWKSVSTRVAEKVAATDTLPDTPDWDVWAGELTPTPELNDRVFREWRDRSTPERLAHLEATHTRLMATLSRLRWDRLAPGDDAGALHEYVEQPGWRHPRTHRTHAEAALDEAATPKNAFLEDVERQHAAAASRFAALTDADLERPIFGEGPGWRIRELIAHLIPWYRVGARVARKLAWSEEVPTREGGGMRGYIGLPAETADQFNARVTAEARGRSRDDVVADLAAAQRAFVEAVRVLPSAKLIDPSTGRPLLGLWVAGYEHLRQHLEHLDVALGSASAATPA